MEKIREEFMKWLSVFAKGKAINRLDIAEEAFKAGYEAAMKSVQWKLDAYKHFDDLIDESENP